MVLVDMTTSEPSLAVEVHAAAQPKGVAALDAPVFAPVKAGQKLGTVTVTLNGKALHSEPLVALTDLPEGGWWRRLTDTLRLWFKSLTGS